MFIELHVVTRDFGDVTIKPYMFNTDQITRFVGKSFGSQGAHNSYVVTSTGGSYDVTETYEQIKKKLSNKLVP